MGYHRAGFTEIVGIDIKPQPRYPFTFIQADALQPPVDLKHFDLIHASPPCQAYTPLQAVNPGKSWPDLLDATRELLIKSGRPYVIENVMSAPLRGDIVLCGEMFGLRTYRHRRFELSHLVFRPEHPRHTRKTSTKKRRKCFEAGMNISVTGDVGKWIGPQVMGIDWMNGNELSQAIPPAYTEWIGKRIMEIAK